MKTWSKLFLPDANTWLACLLSFASLFWKLCCKHFVENPKFEKYPQKIGPKYNFLKIRHNLSTQSPHIYFLLKRMHNHTGCICLTFLRCVFSNVSSNCLPLRTNNHTGCIYLDFLHCAISNVSSNHLPQKMNKHTGSLYVFWCFWQLM